VDSVDFAANGVPSDSQMIITPTSDMAARTSPQDADAKLQYSAEVNPSSAGNAGSAVNTGSAIIAAVGETPALQPTPVPE